MAGQGFLLKSVNFMNGWLLSTNRVCLIVNQNPVRTLKVETRERLKSLKIPDKPKRPLNPYMLFAVEKRINILKENPNLKSVDVCKKVAQEWKTVTEDQKAKYQEKYKKEQEIYDQEVLDYNISLTEEQREALHAAGMEKKQEKKKRKLTKLIKENHKPKKPPGPYLLYLKEQSQIKNIPINILMKSTKDEWSKVPESEKQRFKNDYLKEVAKYEIELNKWEQKMMADGHPELVRAKSKVHEKPLPSSRILDVKQKKTDKQQEFECLRSDSSATAGEDTLFHIETTEKQTSKKTRDLLLRLNELHNTGSGSENVGNVNKTIISDNSSSCSVSRDRINSVAEEDRKNLMTKKMEILNNKKVGSKYSLVDKFWKFFKKF